MLLYCILRDPNGIQILFYIPDKTAVRELVMIVIIFPYFVGIIHEICFLGTSRNLGRCFEVPPKLPRVGRKLRLKMQRIWYG